LFHHYDGTNANWTFWYVDNGDVYRFDSARTPAEVEDSGSTAFASDSIDLYSFISFGDFMIFADRGEHTPYCSDSNDANLSKLISSGTEYKFRYLETFQGRILGAYSDQTNGDIEIRWSNLLPTPGTSCTFGASDQIYRTMNDRIAGIKRLGYNACYVYGEESIDLIQYFANYSTPFGAVTIVPNEGAVNHHSIVSTGDRHFLFNKNLGFCEYRGTSEFPFGGKPISEAIEDRVAAIGPAYYNRIVGAYLPQTRELAWTVPTGGGAIPNQIWFYDLLTQQWRFENKAARYIDHWELAQAFSWQDLADDLGGSTAVWTDITAGTIWTDYTGGRKNRLVIGNTNGHLYYYGGEDDAGGAYSGTRIEPMLDFGRPEERDLLLEIWMGINYRGNYNIDVYHRGGDTEAEVANTSWTSKGTISCNDPTDAVLYLAESARLHQIKWETDAADERFAVNHIEFVYQPQSRY
jgi:hypothetical protein